MPSYTQDTKPSAGSYTNDTKPTLSIAETWISITTTWGTETRTWVETAAAVAYVNDSKPS